LGSYFCGEFIIPKIWCFFYVKAPTYEVVLIEKSNIYTNFSSGKVEIIIKDHQRIRLYQSDSLVAFFV